LTDVHNMPVVGSQASPTGFRSPLANIRAVPVAMSISQMAARPSSWSMPFSATLLFEPTAAYNFVPSALAISPLVQ
jgi:hypothetical protein